jgi:hypothetical protein
MDGVLRFWLHIALEVNYILKIAGSMAGSIAGRDAPALFLSQESNDTLKIAESMAGSIAGRDAPCLPYQWPDHLPCMARGETL